MKNNNFMRLGAFAFLCASVSTAWSQDAWWSFCDTCVGDSSFRHHATLVEVEGTIYVSNRSTNQTQKFNRWVTYEDFSDGVVRMVHVFQANMSTSEKSVFHDVIQSAMDGFVVVPRDRLVDFGAQDNNSALDDIAFGQLSGNFIRGLRAYLIGQGYFPGANEASQRLGADVRVFSFDYKSSASEGVRTNSLGARVEYPDGSSIGLTFSPDGQRVNEITVTDAEGKEIQIIGQDADGNTVINLDTFINRDFVFGPDAQLTMELFDWISRTLPDVTCSWTIIDENHVRVTCRPA